MMKFRAHDRINDIAIIQTTFGFNVRYGLQVTLHGTLDAALIGFASSQRHALAADLEPEPEERPDRMYRVSATFLTHSGDVGTFTAVMRGKSLGDVERKAREQIELDARHEYAGKMDMSVSIMRGEECE